jgi:hypothetical protein
MIRAAEPYGQMAAQVQSMMMAAMRADPTALAVRAGELAGRGELDPHSAGFVREARRLVLCAGAALLSVLEAHRPDTDTHGAETCTGCGAPACRTLRLVSEVLTAYLGGRPCGVDRAEAWRRADVWFAHESGERLLARLRSGRRPGRCRLLQDHQVWGDPRLRELPGTRAHRRPARRQGERPVCGGLSAVRDGPGEARLRLRRRARRA